MPLCAAGMFIVITTSLLTIEQTVPFNLPESVQPCNSSIVWSYTSPTCAAGIFIAQIYSNGAPLSMGSTVYVGSEVRWISGLVALNCEYGGGFWNSGYHGLAPVAYDTSPFGPQCGPVHYSQPYTVTLEDARGDNLIWSWSVNCCGLCTTGGDSCGAEPAPDQACFSGQVAVWCYAVADCDGDMNSDGVVDVDDLLLVLNNWGYFNVDDLLIVINEWDLNCAIN